MARRWRADTLRKLIAVPLGLRDTRLFAPGVAALPLRNGLKVLDIPLALASMPVDGGIVSSTRDLLVFARAFFTGKLFPAGYLTEMANWRRIFFPLESGIGMLRFICRAGSPRSTAHRT